MRKPLNTYRLQFRGGFDFEAARKQLDYLQALGITDIYASPLFTARPDSSHGYDVTDPTTLDPALGGEQGFNALSDDLRSRGMGLLLDIVPNHMAADPSSPWWYDVLTHGPKSDYAKFFAIDWRAQNGKILMPILGAPYGTVLERNEITITFGKRPEVSYFDHRLPLDPSTVNDLKAPTTQAGIHALLEAQNYRLAWWKTANREINYRRFFDVGELISLRTDDPVVFRTTHKLIADLIKSQRVTGLRVDHVDGLRDPSQYLKRLATLTNTFIVVEKILAESEQLPDDWPVDGTTGYEFMNVLAAVFADKRATPKLDALFKSWTHDERSFDDVVWTSKLQVLNELFGADVNRIHADIAASARRDLRARDLDPDGLRQALIALTAALGVYRTYATKQPMNASDINLLSRAAAEARTRCPHLDDELSFVSDLLSSGGDLTMRWQQLTGPAMAKGYEDTALYRYVRLISRNAVGGEPDPVALPTDALHAMNRSRRRRNEYPLATSSTHDTKRSEDVRARIDVLTEVPDRCAKRVNAWRRINKPHRRVVDGMTVPTGVEELLLYQTLVGAWPLLRSEANGFTARIQAYMLKAAREAKSETSWTHPNEDHETALRQFIAAALSPRNETFRSDLESFVDSIAWHGAINSLSQTVLKAMSPGACDTYQGTETWDLSLVDPDNRRPVDYAQHTAQLKALKNGTDPDDLIKNWRDGRLKLWVSTQLLNTRRELPDVFTDGAYTPLEPKGPRAGHIVAAARHTESDWAIACVPRLTASLCRPDRIPSQDTWRGTTIALPAGAPSKWTEVFTNRTVSANEMEAGRSLAVRSILRDLPVALLIKERT